MLSSAQKVGGPERQSSSTREGLSPTATNNDSDTSCYEIQNRGGACYDSAYRGLDGLQITAAGYQIVAARLFPVGLAPARSALKRQSGISIRPPRGALLDEEAETLTRCDRLQAKGLPTNAATGRSRATHGDRCRGAQPRTRRGKIKPISRMLQAAGNVFLA
jgi:hypothetical protein